MSLPVSQHISLNRSGLQIDPLACNCLEGRGRAADGLMRGKGGKVKREERKNTAMLMTERRKLCEKTSASEKERTQMLYSDSIMVS